LPARARADSASEGVGRTPRSRSGDRGGGDGSDQSPERAKRGGGERNGERGRRASTHVVEAGDSLWLIAESVLGKDGSDAQVAAEVERLWQLNAGRIGTGDPDLIYPGQELRLT
jgi:nucleoid-associated protein YgaU